jgi:hypothetical protein
MFREEKPAIASGGRLARRQRIVEGLVILGAAVWFAVFGLRALSARAAADEIPAPPQRTRDPEQRPQIRLDGKDVTVGEGLPEAPPDAAVEGQAAPGFSDGATVIVSESVLTIANPPTCLSGTVTLAAGAGGDFCPPAYGMLGDPKFREELHLSPEQMEKLREISAAAMRQFAKDSQEAHEQSRKMPLEKRQAWLMEKLEQQGRERGRAARKPIEAVLTSQQLNAYKRRALTLYVFNTLAGDAEVAKIIGLAQAQEEQLLRIWDQYTGDALEREQKHCGSLLAVLTPVQREKLDAEIRIRLRGAAPGETALLGGLPPAAEPAAPAPPPRAGADEPPAGTGTVTLTVNEGTLTFSAGYDYADLALPAYRELNSDAVRKQVGLGVAQEKRLREISDKHGKDWEKAALENERAYEKFLPGGVAPGTMTPEQQAKFAAYEREMRELQRRSEESLKEVARQIEAVLTPQQLAGLKEMTSRRRAASAVLSAEFQKKIAVTDPQKARLRQIAEEFVKQSESSSAAAPERALAVLTTAQQQKLREELDRRDEW